MIKRLFCCIVDMYIRGLLWQISVLEDYTHGGVSLALDNKERKS